MRKFLATAATSLMVIGLAACLPVFPAGGTLTAENVDPYVVLSWPQAGVQDAGTSIASYRIDVDGAQVSLVPDWASSCVLKGLQNSTSYTVTVSAIDTSNQRSAVLSTQHTTQDTGDAGSELFCDTAPPPPPPD